MYVVGIMQNCEDTNYYIVTIYLSFHDKHMVPKQLICNLYRILYDIIKYYISTFKPNLYDNKFATNLIFCENKKTTTVK